MSEIKAKPGSAPGGDNPRASNHYREIFSKLTGPTSPLPVKVLLLPGFFTD